MVLAALIGGWELLLIAVVLGVVVGVPLIVIAIVLWVVKRGKDSSSAVSTKNGGD